MGLIERFAALFKRQAPAAARTTADEQPAPQSAGRYLDVFTADRERAEIVRQCREMYRTDGRVKRVLATLARDATRGGFTIQSDNARASETAQGLIDRLSLARRLTNDVRLTLRDGDSFMEIGIDEGGLIVSLTRKPTLEIHRNSDRADRFADPARAYWWAEVAGWGTDAPPDAVWFAQWQMVHARWAHDEGSRYGAPLFAEATGAFKRLREGEIDVAVRRKTRAGMKYHHVVEGDEADLERYKRENRAALDNPYAANLDFFSNKAGGITTIQGDANVEQIGDVMHHLRTFFVASPLPMELIAYGQDVNRDVLEDMREQYNEDLQQITVWVETEFVRPLVDLQLLLAGILPETAAYKVHWQSKKVLTPVMLRDAADAALRLRAFGFDDATILNLMGSFLPDIDLSLVTLNGDGAPALADAAGSL